MQTTIFMSVGAQGMPTTYLTLGAVLSLLVLLTLWREMSTGGATRFFPRSFAVLSFMISRVLVIVFGTSIVATQASPPIMYLIINLACVFLILRGGDRSTPPEQAAEDNEDAADVRETPRLIPGRRRVYSETALVALLGGLIYMIVPSASDVAFSSTGLIVSVTAGATLRVLLYMFYGARQATGEQRWMNLGFVMSLTLSWILVIGASLSPPSTATVMLVAARVMDICVLITGLLALQANYIVTGHFHKNRADLTEEEWEKTKAELTLMDRVASDLHEDSSLVIQQQHVRSREQIRRIDSLEKILEIGMKIQRHQDLRELLQLVSELIRDNLGFNTVILRILNQRTQSFETKAFVATNEDVREAVMSHRVPLAEYERLLEPRFKISRSYFLRNLTPVEDLHGVGGMSAETVHVTDHWHDIERLIVPLIDEQEETIGYISVEEPADTDASVVHAIDNLEAIAALVAIAIQNTTYYKEVGEKNQKLKLYTEKLAGLNKMKANFVATISHEFRTPLTSIKAYCETLLQNADKVDRNILKEFLVVIDEESNHLMTIIEDILDFSQMESGAVKFERSPCHMNDVVKGAIEEMRANFERKNITVIQDLPDAKVMVRGEVEQMKQLVSNLLHNASKFTAEDGNVRVTLEDESVSARLIIEDDGIGIPEDQIDQVFDHFHQADNTSTRRYGGTGIGLAICKNIVEWHDGKIWVENIPGRGARFIVVIPKKQVTVRSHTLDLDGTMRRYEVERYLELLVEIVVELMNVRRSSIMLVDEETGGLRIECAVGLDEDIVEKTNVKIGEGIAGKVAREATSYLVEDIETDPRVATPNNAYLYDSKSFLSVPIMDGHDVVGVINVSNPITKEQFDSSDRGLLEIFAERLALAISMLKSFVDKSAEFEGIRGAFRSILDARRYVDDQDVMAILAVLREVGVRLGMSDKETAVLLYVFNVYDLGLAKSGYNIVKQPRNLTAEDRSKVERHTIVGTEMLRPIEKMTNVRDAVLYHHENFDGTGYPGKLSGEEIPRDARIIRIADTFRALLSHRPYQKQYSVEEAVDVLRHRSGTFFDPKIANVFIEVVEERAELFRKVRQPSSVPDEHVEELAYSDQGSN